MTVEQQAQPGYDGDAVVVRSLSFSYPDSPPVVDGFSLSLPRGSRCLLCGANGAGERGPPEMPALQRASEVCSGIFSENLAA